MTPEEGVAFDCAGDTLVGVLHRPAAASDAGVVVVVGGPQYRAGSHRQFVSLARSLAAAGHPVLRFDQRGSGDSSGALGGFDAIDADIASAVGMLLQRCPQLRHVVLWGLCDGASAALLYLQRTGDPRVSALCLLNPWVRAEQTLARTQVRHYYGQRLLQPAFWRKLLLGGVARGAWSEFTAKLRQARQTSGSQAADGLDYQTRMLHGWQRFGGPVQLILSGNDYTAKEFLMLCSASGDWAALLTAARTERCDIAGADHTFSDAASQAQVEQRTLSFLQRLRASAAIGRAAPSTRREAA